MKLKQLIILAALAGLPATANATSFVGDFGGSGFSYGFGNGITFGGAPGATANCFGKSGVLCFTEGTSGDDRNNLPLIGKNTTGATVNLVDAVELPTDVLLLHPGASPTDTPAGTSLDAIVLYTIQKTGAYDLSTTFSSLDGNAALGNGSLASVYTYSVGDVGPTTLYSSVVGVGTPYSHNAVYNFTAGEYVYISVGNNGSYNYDSTGLSGFISSVPEPATWSMMLLGFGFVGFGLRGRRKRTMSASYT